MSGLHPGHREAESLADANLQDYDTDPPSHPYWNPKNITKPVREGYTHRNVEAPHPTRCATWRNLHGPFWGDIKLTAPSGIQLRYGGPNGGSREPPGLRRQGTGIKWRGQKDTWNGFLNERSQLHEMEFPRSHFGIIKEPTGTFKLPVMGMPPRAPKRDMIERIQNGSPFDVTDWFRDATVGKASTYFHEECLTIGEETVTITISPAYEFEVAEAEQGHRAPPDNSLKTYENLYFIQLMPNELPSYVIYLDKNEQALVDTRISLGKYRNFSSTDTDPKIISDLATTISSYKAKGRSTTDSRG